MKRRLFALGALLLLPVAALAQATTAGGEVAKLDKGGERITLKHTGIKNLEMPPMVMSFHVRDPKIVEGLAVGDRVRFVAERVDGQYTITALSKAP
jgi:Cu/Ag efflux protein CusF